MLFLLQRHIFTIERMTGITVKQSDYFLIDGKRLLWL